MRQQRGKVRSCHLARGAGDGEPCQNPDWARTQGFPGGIVGNDAPAEQVRAHPAREVAIRSDERHSATRRLQHFPHGDGKG